MRVEAVQVGAKAEAQAEAGRDEDQLVMDQVQTIIDGQGPDETTVLLDLDHQMFSVVDQMATPDLLQDPIHLLNHPVQEGPNSIRKMLDLLHLHQHNGQKDYHQDLL